MTPGFKDSELGRIPEDWECQSIRDAASKTANSIVGGPFGSDLVSSDYVGSGIPVIRGQNMSKALVGGDFVFVSPQKAKSLSANLARSADLVFTQRGTLGQVALVPSGSFDSYLISQSQMKVSLDPSRHDPSFVQQYFLSGAGQKQIVGSAIQTGVPHTNLGILRSYQFPAPPLAEQKAIAAALSDVDALLGALDRLIAKKRDLKHAAMQQLLTGQTRLPGFSGKWETRRLGDFGAFTNGINKAKEDFGYGFPFANLMDVFGVPKISLQTTFNLVNSSPTEREHYELKKGDVLFVRSSVKPSGVGLTTLVQEDLPNTVFSGFLLRFRDSGVLTSEFKEHCFAESGFRKRLIASSSVSANTNINQVALRALTLTFPAEKDEQHSISAVLSEMDAELVALEQRRDKTRLLKQGMMQELLTGRTRLV